MKNRLGSGIKLFSLLITTSVSLLFSQLPDPNYFYYHNTGSTQFYNYNTTTNANSLNTIAVPSGNIGFAVNNNFFGATPAMTYYTLVGGTFHYYNGSTWVNTGHTAGAVNIGGAGIYMYAYNGSSGQIYRYNGTGNAVLITTLASFGGPYDVTGDASGNFFILKSNAAPHNLRQFSPTGTLMATYTMTGFPNGSAGGGFAFINGRLYADISGIPVWGTISGTNITYGGPLTLSVTTGDFANWPLPINPLPVELLSWYGAYNTSTRMNDLTWITSSELNNDYFTIEYSSDAIDWNVLEIVQGAGNSNEPKTYHAYHDSPFEDTYYRLTQTDLNGESKTYDWLIIHKEIEEVIAIYPNPVSDYCLIQSSLELPYHVEIRNENGSLVKNLVITQLNEKIDLTDLSNGIYFAMISAENQKMVTKIIRN